MNGDSSQFSERPRLAITLGDPDGIGPEVVLKCLRDAALREQIDPLVIGSASVLRAHAGALGFDDLAIYEVERADAPRPPEGLSVLDVAGGPPPTVEFGAVTAAGGRLAMRAVAAAADACIAGHADAMVTAPLSKEAIQRGGYEFPGHTEFLAERTGGHTPLMMMVAGPLRVGVVTAHIPLAAVADAVTTEAIQAKLRLMHDSLRRDFGIEAPDIAVLGLNPHAGDGGVIGMEEQTIIRPALEAVQAEGLRVAGPFPADGYFATERDRHDAVLAMYHDQGLVPFKALAFDEGVNFTAGLPIVRTSPDHGTAFNIAGQGVASPGSMRSAIALAVEVARRRSAVKADRKRGDDEPTRR